MISRSKEEHENYKDELGDNEPFSGPNLSTLIEQELYCCDYRPRLYEYLETELESRSRKIKSYLNDLGNFVRMLFTGHASYQKS